MAKSEFIDLKGEQLYLIPPEPLIPLILREEGPTLFFFAVGLAAFSSTILVAARTFGREHFLGAATLATFLEFAVATLIWAPWRLRQLINNSTVNGTKG